MQYLLIQKQQSLPHFDFDLIYIELRNSLSKIGQLERGHLALLIIKISKTPCPTTVSSSNFETREFMFEAAFLILLTLFLLTFFEFFDVFKR